MYVFKPGALSIYLYTYDTNQASRTNIYIPNLHYLALTEA